MSGTREDEPSFRHPLPREIKRGETAGGKAKITFRALRRPAGSGRVEPLGCEMEPESDDLREKPQGRERRSGPRSITASRRRARVRGTGISALPGGALFALGPPGGGLTGFNWPRPPLRPAASLHGWDHQAQRSSKCHPVRTQRSREAGTALVAMGNTHTHTHTPIHATLITPARHTERTSQMKAAPAAVAPSRLPA